MNLRIDEPERNEGEGDSEEEGMEIVSRMRKIMNGTFVLFFERMIVTGPRIE